MAVTVIEYLVPSSRPVSVYLVSLPLMPDMVLVSLKQPVLTLELDTVKVLASLNCVHDIVSDVLIEDVSSCTINPVVVEGWFDKLMY